MTVHFLQNTKQHVVVHLLSKSKFGEFADILTIYCRLGYYWPIVQCKNYTEFAQNLRKW